jgi:hypothetical protein
MAKRPSGLTARALTPDVWLSSTATARPLAASQRRARSVAGAVRRGGTEVAARRLTELRQG